MSNILLNNRKIFLTGTLDDDVANSIVEKMLQYEEENPYENINLLINSHGGSVTAGFAIYDVINYLKCDVNTICMGLAASMAGFLLSSGTPGKRFSFPNAQIMIHQLHSKNEGQASDLIIRATQAIRIKNKMAKIMSYNCDQPIDVIIRAMDRDTFFSAKEALNFGLIDDII